MTLQRAQQSRANIACNGHMLFSFLQHVCTQTRDRGFAIGPCHHQHIRSIVSVGLQVIERLCEKTQLVTDFQSLRLGL